MIADKQLDLKRERTFTRNMTTRIANLQKRLTRLGVEDAATAVATARAHLREAEKALTLLLESS